jgi:serine/threonine protein kinase
VNGHGGPNLAWLQQQFPDLQQIVSLSSGGQKQVFAATHPQDGAVVLKLIHPRQDMETTRREMLAVNQLVGARVPAILDSGTLQTQFGDFFWFREQRVDGQTLRQRIQAGPLSVHEVLKLGFQVLETLVQSEAVHIVHRDVRSEKGTFMLFSRLAAARGYGL